MLRRTDIPLVQGWGRFSCTHCGQRVLDAAEANQALMRGSTIFPADAATAERVAARLEQAGDPKRADLIRTWSVKRFLAAAVAADVSGDSTQPAVAPEPEAPVA